MYCILVLQEEKRHTAKVGMGWGRACENHLKRVRLGTELSSHWGEGVVVKYQHHRGWGLEDQMAPSEAGKRAGAGRPGPWESC